MTREGRKEGRNLRPHVVRPIRNVSRRVPNNQPIGMFQQKNIQPVRNVPVHSIQPVRIFQYKLFSQYRYSSTNHSVSKDIPVKNIQSVGIFDYKIFSQ